MSSYVAIIGPKYRLMCALLDAWKLVFQIASISKTLTISNSPLSLQRCREANTGQQTLAYFVTAGQFAHLAFCRYILAEVTSDDLS